MRRLAIALTALLAATSVSRADPVEFRLDWVGFSQNYTWPGIAVTEGGRALEVDQPSFALKVRLADGATSTVEPWDEDGEWRTQLPLSSVTLTRLGNTSGARFSESVQLTARFTDLASGEQADVTQRFSIKFDSGEVILTTGGEVTGVGDHSYHYSAWAELSAVGDAAAETTVIVDYTGPVLPPMPEPSTFALLALGGLGLLGWRHRRRPS